MGDEDEATATLGAEDLAWVGEGEYLYREGDVAYDFFVLVSAEVDLAGFSASRRRHRPSASVRFVHRYLAF